MFGSENFFLAPLDTDAQTVAKAVRLTSAILGQNGRVEVTGTDAVRPTLSQAGFAVIIATADAIVATLEYVDPVTKEFVSDSDVALASGESRFGFFTLVQLTSGSVLLFPISKQGEAPAVPHLAGAYALASGVTLSAERISGGAAPSTVVVQRKVNSGAYAALGSPADTADGTATVVDDSPGSMGDVVKYRAAYAEAYDSGVALGRQGAFSNEVTLTLPDSRLSALTISSGILTGAFDKDTASYTDDILTGVATVTVTPTRNQAGATIQVKVGTGAYATVASGAASGALAMAIGANTITIKVTAADGATISTYSIVVTRAAE